jgi:hypothetical protein
MTKSVIAVITTVQPPTVAVRKLQERISAVSGQLLVVGDRKGPVEYSLHGAQYYSLTDQQSLGFGLSAALPENHYSRKNLGFLEAIAQGARCIYETDDDNIPLPHWAVRECRVHAILEMQAGWVNAYSHFSGERIWPRGFPLDAIGDRSAVSKALPVGVVSSPIHQGLANGSPDVDAVWRLVLDRPFEFENDAPSLWLGPGCWCPFNSQSTWWFPEAYPLMYLPSHCSFRMTDIWRSLVAQRCLWELGHGVVFHAPEVFQERNLHDLMRDFSDEVVGYLRNREMARILEDLPLKPGIGHLGDNLNACYESLVGRGFFPQEELRLLQGWLADLHALKEAGTESTLA